MVDLPKTWWDNTYFCNSDLIYKKLDQDNHDLDTNSDLMIRQAMQKAESTLYKCFACSVSTRSNKDQTACLDISSKLNLAN